MRYTSIVNRIRAPQDWAKGRFAPILLRKSFCEAGLKFSDP